MSSSYSHDNRGKIGHLRFAKSTALGVQWKPKNNMLANLEYHYVDGTVWLIKEENGPDGHVSRYWNMLVMSLSYRFK